MLTPTGRLGGFRYDNWTQARSSPVRALTTCLLSDYIEPTLASGLFQDMPKRGVCAARDLFPATVVLLVAAWWRWKLWTQFHFREDEALYAHWAWLIHSGIDPLLARTPVDKPPLFPYLLNEVYRIFTPSEAAARLPNLFASTLTLPLLYGWARAVAGQDVARYAMWTYAVLPLAVLMAPTAYTDPLMVFFCVLAAWAAARRGTGWALVSGLALGAGVATKPFAALWLPLVWWSGRRDERSWRWPLLWSLGFVYPLARWGLWEAARPEPDALTLSVQHYGGMALPWPGLWPSRVAEWTRVVAASTGGLLWMAIWASLAGAGLRWAGRTRRTLRPLGVWVVGILGLYVLGPLEAWDRYLLLVAPPFAVLVGHGWARLHRRTNGGKRLAVLLLLASLVLGGRAGNAAYPVGGDHGAYDGVDALAAFIMATLPKGGILYHRWLGWHYGFYLFAAPYDYRWWQDPRWLAQDACVPDGLPRLIAFPFWAEDERQEAVAALRAAGVDVVLFRRIYGRDGRLRFYLYRLVPAGCGTQGAAKAARTAPPRWGSGGGMGIMQAK